MDKMYLILESGDVFEGRRLGAEGEVIGEVVFTTGMTGYAATICDPFFYGQIAVQTFPLIGNCGIIPAEINEKGIGLKGYIIRQLCDTPSNFRCEGELGEFLKERGIVAMQDVDTRRLTRVIREKGVMNGIITSSPKLSDEQKKALGKYTVKGGVKAMSASKASVIPAQGKVKAKVALIDLGGALGVAKDLAARGCEAHILPNKVSAEEILGGEYNGVVLSAGPGNPAENEKQIKLASELLASGIAMLGVGLGHQIMALSQGAEAVKMKCGHRGGNQPVKKVGSDKIIITSQNHGYTVDIKSLPKSAKVTYINVNDGTCEGIKYSKKASSVQFAPESGVGPLDAQYILDEFVKTMEVK